MTTITDKLTPPSPFTPSLDSLDAAEFGQAARSVFNGLKPALSLALPAIRRINWRIVAVGVAAGAAAYVVRSMLSGRADRTRRRVAPPLPAPDVHRWENEGGMIAVSVPSAPKPPDANHS